MPPAGGKVSLDVGLTQTYAVGPAGMTDPATGGPYLGLYQTTFFPFTDGVFSVQA